MKIKPLSPSLREKKRYLAFEIISKAKINSYNPVKDAIKAALGETLGVIGMAKAGAILLDDAWNSTKQRGLIRINHKYVNDIKFALMKIKKIKNQDIIFRSLGVSGIIKKAHDRYIAS